MARDREYGKADLDARSAHEARRTTEIQEFDSVREGPWQVARLGELRSLSCLKPRAWFGQSEGAESLTSGG